MEILLRKKAPTRIFLGQIKCIAHCSFSVCLLNTNSFYHDLAICEVYPKLTVNLTVCCFTRATSVTCFLGE